MRSSRAESIIAAVSWLALRGRRPTSCNVSSTRQHESSRTRASPTHFRRSQLHWLDVVDRVRFRVCVQVFRRLHKMTPEYLSTYCQPVSGISGRHHLRSAERVVFLISHVWNLIASYGGRSFAYAGHSNWNSLLAYLRDSSLSLSSFKRHLKTFRLAAHAARLGFFYKNALYKFTAIINYYCYLASSILLNMLSP